MGKLTPSPMAARGTGSRWSKSRGPKSPKTCAKLWRGPRSKSVGGGVLHDGDRERISRARAILDDSFADPPMVAVLARTVGLNRNKLSYGFRHLHDRSMSDYLAEKRLDAAWRLLQDGVPVGAVAEAVGYRHVGSFSAAFSRRYGLAPSSLRRNKCGTPKSS